MKIALCDDDINFLEIAGTIIEEKCRSIDFKMKIYTFKSPQQCISEHENNPFDIVFLDINMHEMDGFKLSMEIRRLYEEAEIVFVTAIDEIIYQAVDYRPFSFIRKELFKEEIEKVILRLKMHFYKKVHFIIAEKEEGLYKVNSKDIYYIESKKNYIEIHTEDNIYKKRYKMETIEDELADYGFLRVHSGFVINKKYWLAIINNDVILKNNTKIPISRSRRKNIEIEFMKKFR